MSTQNQTGYMLLFVGMDWHKGLSPEQTQKVSEDWMAWFKRLNEQGKAVAGHPRAEIALLLGEAATEQGDEERGYTLVRTAVDMLGPDPEPLLASRVYSALGIASAPEAMVGRHLP